MQHSVWHKVPMVRLLAAFACGVSISMFVDIGMIFIGTLFIVLVLLFGIIPFFFKAFHHRWYPGIVATLLFVTVGMFVQHYQRQQHDTDHFSNVAHAKKYTIVTSEQPVMKTASFKMKAQVFQVTDSLGNVHVAKGNMVLYLKQSDSLKVPEYGDVMIIDARLVKEVQAPKNPGEFDYKRYLAFNHIHHQAYVHSSGLYFTNMNSGSKLIKSVYHIRTFFTRVMKEFIVDPVSVGVAQALLYGDDDHIDDETMSAYANTGTLHVLAVSGMHVGIIFYIISHVLFFMNRNKKLMIVKRVLIIICLWAYSALCGLSPSILRATVMFTFIIMAELLERKSNIYNTLASSCLVLLCTDANMLANVGFQLSYLAVAGIVFLQPYIYRWYVATSWLGDQVWKITSVSIAAQLATCPVGILYFHQFPNCFLFSNLLIIPLTTLILYLCMALLLVSEFPLIAGFTGLITCKLIGFTNTLVKLMEDVPYAYIDGLQINIIQSILLYMLLISFVFFLLYRYHTMLKCALFSTAMFLLIAGWNRYDHLQQKQLWIYGISRADAVNIIQGKTSLLLLDESLKNNPQKFRFHLRQHLWQCDAEPDTKELSGNWVLISIGRKTMLITGKGACRNVDHPDILMIRNTVTMKELNEINPKVVVISGSVPRKDANQFKKQFSTRNIPVFDVMDSGAFRLIL